MGKKIHARNGGYPHALKYTDNAGTMDLVRYVMFAIRNAWRRMDVRDIMPRKEAARLAYDAARALVEYRRESGDQLVRMPWRAIEEGVGDCKTTAVLIASLCQAAGCRVTVRFVKYGNEDHYGHVYAVVDGVPVDPELAFGDEVVYASALDRDV